MLTDYINIGKNKNGNINQSEKHQQKSVNIDEFFQREELLLNYNFDCWMDDVLPSRTRIGINFFLLKAHFVQLKALLVSSTNFKRKWQK